MVNVGLDLSRKRLDVCALDAGGELLLETAVPPDADGLRRLVARVGPGAPVRAAIESMNGARFVHDELERAGWQVAIADAHKTKGIAPLACKTDRIDARVLATLACSTWCPRSGCPTRRCAPSVSAPATGCTWSNTAAPSSNASRRS